MDLIWRSEKVIKFGADLIWRSEKKIKFGDLPNFLRAKIYPNKVIKSYSTQLIVLSCCELILSC